MPSVYGWVVQTLDDRDAWRLRRAARNDDSPRTDSGAAGVIARKAGGRPGPLAVSADRRVVFWPPR